jgi:hypothetical protein
MSVSEDTDPAKGNTRLHRKAVGRLASVPQAFSSCRRDILTTKLLESGPDIANIRFVRKIDRQDNTPRQRWIGRRIDTGMTAFGVSPARIGAYAILVSLGNEEHIRSLDTKVLDETLERQVGLPPGVEGGC